MSLTVKGTATRERIIAGAAQYLRSELPGEVTLDDVRAVTRTSKSQLFHYFPGGKDELMLAAARYEADQVLADQEPHLGALTNWAAWDAWRAAVLKRYRAQGRNCPLGSLMSQVNGTPGAAEVVTTLLDEWQRRIRRGIDTLQAQGLADPDLDAGRLAAVFLAGIQGGVQILRTTGSTAHLEAVFDHLLDQLRAGRTDAAPAR
jgi:AcrR family transcriptional regulator